MVRRMNFLARIREMTPSALQTHPPMGKFKGYVRIKTHLNSNIMQLYFSMIHSFAWLVIKKKVI